MGRRWRHLQKRTCTDLLVLDASGCCCADELSLLLAVLDLLLVVFAQHCTLLRHGPCWPFLKRLLLQAAARLPEACLHSILLSCTRSWLLLCCSSQALAPAASCLQTN